MADFNSKYSGEQVEALLDQVASGNAGGGEGATAVQKVKINGKELAPSNGVVDLGNVVTDLSDYYTKEEVTDHIKESFISRTIVDLSFASKGFYGAGDSHKKFYSNSQFRAVNIPVTNGDIYRFKSVVGGGSSAAIIMYNSEGSVVQVINQGGEEITGTTYEGKVVIPTGVTDIAFSSRAISSDEYYICKEKEITLEDIQSLQDGVFDDISIRDRITMTFVKGATDASVNNAPSFVERTDYLTARADRLQIGDRVLVKAHSGSSYPTLIKLLGDIVVEVSDKNLLVDTIIECDGTFDGVICNNYSGYLSAPSFTTELNVNVGKSIKDINTQLAEVKTQHLRVLCLGNSFTEDTMSYVPHIMESLCPEVELSVAIAFIGGSPLAQHYANLTGETVELDGTVYTPINYTFELYDTKEKVWISKPNVSIEEIVSSQQWDIITLQQSGGSAHLDWDKYYKPYITSIHKRIASLVTKPVTLGWLSIHGSYSTDSDVLLQRWENIVANTKKMMELTPTTIIFPFGTVIQNLRTTPLSSLGDGGNLTADTAHLHDGLPCLATAYVNAMTLAHYAGYPDVSVIGDKFRPTMEWVKNIKAPAPNFGLQTQDVVGVNDSNCYTAQVAAMMAVKYPYLVTDCNDSYEEVI